MLDDAGRRTSLVFARRLVVQAQTAAQFARRERFSVDGGVDVEFLDARE